MANAITQTAERVVEYSDWAKVKPQLVDIEAVADLELRDPAMQKLGWLGSQYSSAHGPKGAVWLYQSVWAPSDERGYTKPRHFRVVANLLTKDAQGPYMHVVDSIQAMDEIDQAWVRQSVVRPLVDDRGRKAWRKDPANAPIIGRTSEQLDVVHFGTTYELAFDQMVAETAPNVDVVALRREIAALTDPRLPLPTPIAA